MSTLASGPGLPLAFAELLAAYRGLLEAYDELLASGDVFATDASIQEVRAGYALLSHLESLR